jgi:hypothetical protein
MATPQAVTRPAGVLPGIDPVAIDPASITIPPSAIADPTTPAAMPTESTGTARIATVTAIDMAEVPRPQQKVTAHAAGAPMARGR